METERRSTSTEGHVVPALDGAGCQFRCLAIVGFRDAGRVAANRAEE